MANFVFCLNKIPGTHDLGKNMKRMLLLQMTLKHIDYLQVKETIHCFSDRLLLNESTYQSRITDQVMGLTLELCHGGSKYLCGFMSGDLIISNKTQTTGTRIGLCCSETLLLSHRVHWVCKKSLWGAEKELAEWMQLMLEWDEVMVEWKIVDGWVEREPLRRLPES